VAAAPHAAKSLRPVQHPTWGRVSDEHVDGRKVPNSKPVAVAVEGHPSAEAAGRRLRTSRERVPVRQHTSSTRDECRLQALCEPGERQSCRDLLGAVFLSQFPEAVHGVMAASIESNVVIAGNEDLLGVRKSVEPAQEVYELVRRPKVRGIAGVHKDVSGRHAEGAMSVVCRKLPRHGSSQERWAGLKSSAPASSGGKGSYPWRCVRARVHLRCESLSFDASWRASGSGGGGA